MLVHPSHPLATAEEVTLAECARQTVIAHNDPSHVRDRVLRLFEQHHIPANILISLPSLEGIKRAVEMQMGVALLPRRCAESRDRARRARGARDAGGPAARGRCGWSTARRRAIARRGGVSGVARENKKRETAG